MAGRPPVPVELTEAQSDILEKIVRRETSPQRLVRRARLILAFEGCKYNQQAADIVGVTRPTACSWRKRWLASREKLKVVETESGVKELSETIEEVLADSPGRGAKPKFSPEQICEIVAVACQRPEDSDRPTTHWTHEELKEEVIQRAIVDSISARQVGRFLKRGRR